MLKGDWRFFWQENIPDFSGIPSSWDASLNTGIGKSAIPTLWINSYLSFTAFFSRLGIPWDSIGLLFWILPAVVLSFVSAYVLWITIFPSQKKFGILAGCLYLFNTYILMVILGGQIGVALAYSVTPFVLQRLLKLIRFSVFSTQNIKYLASQRSGQISNIKYSILAGLMIAIQLLFDPRITYITVGAMFVYFIVSIRHNLIQSVLYVLGIPLGITVLLHSFWILPMMIFGSSDSQLLGGVGSISFFSFAEFENSISLLHPNWPENIFGKVYFMRPEFLLLPIVAYSSLLFIKISKISPRSEAGKYQKSKTQSKYKQSFLSDKQSLNFSQSSKFQKFNADNSTIEQFSNRAILFFSLLGLLGAFLTKGANPPFGELYVWLFKHVPGFIMFRDPTKFYLLVALSYSILIPFVIYSVYEWFKSKIKNQRSKIQSKYKQSFLSDKQSLNFSQSLRFQKFKIFNFSYVYLIFSILYLIFLVFPALRQLPTIFTPQAVPDEYVRLKDFLHSQPAFFRTLWIPQWQRFGYFSNNHPAIGRFEVLKSASASGQIEELKKPGMEEQLKKLGVKYIIVPFDSEGEIFLEDRKYDEGQRKEVENGVDKIFWLRKLNDLNLPAVKAGHVTKIAVYEVCCVKDRFRLISKSSITEQKINYAPLSSTKYIVQVGSAKVGDILVFSESFNQYWSARINNLKIPSTASKLGLNSFVLPKEGNYTVEVFYEPQKWVHAGLLVSGTTLFVILLFFGVSMGRRGLSERQK